MKKITLLFFLLTISFSVRAQFPEDFEASFPPSDWTTFIGVNGLGDSQNWSQISTSDNKTAYLHDQDGSGGTTEDWLVTSQFTPTSTANILTYKQKQAYSNVYGTIYTIRVSTASQTIHSDFIIVDTQVEEDFGTVYTTHNVDLSAYNGIPIYVAFVMVEENEDGDSWFIDDVDVVLNTAPNAVINPSPAHMATNVSINDGKVNLTWEAPITGYVPTSYEVFWSKNSGSLNSIGISSTTTIGMTNAEYSTTYYWKAVPQNLGVNYPNPVEWSFTTEVAPPASENDNFAGAIPITPSVEGTGCTAPGLNLNFLTEGTTDSGMDGSCNQGYTGVDKFFTWTATTNGLLRYPSLNGRDTGIIIRDTSGNEIDCVDTSVSYSDRILSGWSVGDELIIQIYLIDTAPIFNVEICLEEFTVLPPPSNDECSGAVSLSVNTDLLCDNVFSGTNVSSTTSTYVDDVSGTPNDDVWFSFVATHTEHTIKILNIVSQMGGTHPGYFMVIAAYETTGDCDELILFKEFSSNEKIRRTMHLEDLNVSEKYYLRVYESGTSIGYANFDICVGRSPDPFVPNYIEDFSMYPWNWTAGVGTYMNPLGYFSNILQDDFVNDTSHINGMSANVEISGYGVDEYLISPRFDLSATTYYLNLDIALTKVNDTPASVMGIDDYVALIVTEDNGTTWIELTRWDNTNTISETGEAIDEIVLSGYGSETKFAFYAFSDTPNENNDFFIDNFSITVATLGINNNEIDSFSISPTIVKDNLSFTSKEDVELITIYNLMGQEVLSRKPSVTNASINLASLSSGMYIVKIKVGNSLGSYKIIKE